MLSNAKRNYRRVAMKQLSRLSTRATIASLFILALAGAAAAQEQPLHIKYWLGMSRPASHLFEVTIEVELPNDPNLKSLDFQMPKWSPGRYAVSILPRMFRS